MSGRMTEERYTDLDFAWRHRSLDRDEQEELFRELDALQKDKAALEASAEAAESEVAQLRATLYASFDLDKVADTNHAAALERVRRLEEREAEASRLLREGIALVGTLRARVGRVKEALRPFVQGAGDEDENGWVWVQAQLPEEVVAEARALLKEPTP